ncbi:ArsA family ATPase [Microbulbifer sp. YPW1]|uniref:ArsA family ATPase n=1 Tax=Microbulbifer sp. YPW1 TaxID=2745199 RepID=UPI001597A2E8|nr:ArsA family ATPase [Microbulbifer sp. YPW1]QKX18413.1 ArsA family ATPase [Microbulbifer sp. YPW1]
MAQKMAEKTAQQLDLDTLFKRRLLLVGGKGGVGKSSVAATLALMAAQRGQKTLLVSTDPAHNLADIFGCQCDGGEGRLPWQDIALRVLELNPDTVLDDYLESVRKQMLPHISLNMRGPLEKQLHLTRHAPGAEEAALLDALTRLIKQRENYDLIVFDTAPTGHTLRLMSLPGLMNTWATGLLQQKKHAERFRGILSRLEPAKDGAKPGNSDATPAALAPLVERQARFRDAASVLKDSELTGFLFVMTPELLPLQETRRAVAALDSHQVPVAGLVLNRILPVEAEQVPFLRGVYRQQGVVLSQVAEQLSALPQIQIPMRGGLIQGMEGLQQMADVMAAAAKPAAHKQKKPGREPAGH